MQDTEIESDSTCLLCCQEREIFILPKCNHKHICWRCCINMIKEGKFSCPFCKISVNQKQKVIFVTLQHMLQYSYNEILKTSGIELLKSQKNSNYYYSNQQVAEKIQYETNYNCPFEECQQLLDSLNQLKKHLDIKHRKQYCDICLTNRKCIQSEQILYSDNEYQRHVKNGQLSENGDLILFHPTCTFCKQTFYDIDEFRRHLEHVHEKCFICHKNSEELKYVYFENYQQGVEHFKKSHFYCEISTCMGTKFENVFVTEEALQQHVLRVHRKVKQNNQPIMNIMLGFNTTEQESVFQWDKIGKNFSNIFKMVEKSSSHINLKPVQHQDLKLDIRDFYSELCKRTMNISLTRIKQKIQDKMFEKKYKESDLFIDDVDFFKPLEMQPLTKVELERFLFGVFDKKVCDQIVNKFFAGRQDFSNMDQYFGFVKDKMRSFSKVAFYYAFPQLVRFFKTQNPHKVGMDEFYYETLRELKVKRPFIIHTREKYSEILFFMKQLIQKQVQQRDEDSHRSKKQLDVQKYITFLKDTSLTYYVKQQEDIFYVSKEKITNLYHMINKCRVQDFLKMNWLLKIGFSNDAYKIIWKQFYYKEEKDCFHAIKKLNIQELAYLYAYCTICLEAIFEKASFKRNKEKPVPLFLSQILGTIKRSSTHQRIHEVIELEKKFLRSDHHVNYSKDKGVLVTSEDHPSLLDRNIDVAPLKPKPQDKQGDFPTMAGFGTIMPKLWNQPTISLNKNSNNKKNPEDYPSLMSNQTKKQEKRIEQEQFPVFHYVGKKSKKEKALINASMNLNQVGWGGSGYISNNWNEQSSLKNWEKRQEDQKRRIQRHEQIQKQINNPIKTQQKHSSKVEIQDSPKKKDKQKDKQQKPSLPQPQKPKQQQPMVFLVSKKNKKKDEQQESFNPTKKKNKQKKKDQDDVKKNKTQNVEEKKNTLKDDDECGLFEKIQKESEIISKKQKRQQSKLPNQAQTFEPTNKQQNRKVSSKSSYLPQNPSNEIYSKDQFPALAFVKNNQKQINQTLSSANDKSFQDRHKVEQKPKQMPSKKRKMRADDTSSDEQLSKKQEHKKSDDFVSISQKFKNNGQQKISKVNQIIQNAKVEEKPQNFIQVKKNKKGKKQLIQTVNFYNLW